MEFLKVHGNPYWKGWRNGMSREDRKRHLQAHIDTMEVEAVGEALKSIYGENFESEAMSAFRLRMNTKAAKLAKKRHVCENTKMRRGMLQEDENGCKDPRRMPQEDENGCKGPPQCTCPFCTSVVGNTKLEDGKPPPKEFREEDRKSQLKACIEKNEDNMDKVENVIGEDEFVRSYISMQSSKSLSNKCTTDQHTHNPLMCKFWREEYELPAENLSEPHGAECTCDINKELRKLVGDLENRDGGSRSLVN